MGLNQFIEAQLREKVENEWLTKEEAKKIWRQRREIRVAIRKLYQAKGDGLILEDELMFVEHAVTSLIWIPMIMTPIVVLSKPSDLFKSSNQ